MATGSLGARKSVDLAVQIVRGLAAAHEKGIVHRDLKPENLFLTKDGLVKILDFGIAKLGRPGEEPAGTDIETLSHTSPGTILGTVGYMSPEQVRGQATDHRSDLFSFGTVLFEMLTGKRAFKGTTPADTLSAILREDPTETIGTGSTLSPGLLRVLQRCLEKAPEDRFQTARDLAFALEGATTGSPITPSETRPVGRRSRGFWATASALALAAAGTSLGLWLGRGRTRAAGLLRAPHLPPRPRGSGAVRAGRGDDRLQRPLGQRSDRGVLHPGDHEGIAVLGAAGRLDPRHLVSGRAGPAHAAPGPHLVRVRRHPGARPMAGGTPREVLEGVLDADWSPDGKDLAVIHLVGDRYRLEYPIGRVLYEPEPPGWISDLRISPRGDQVAFIEHTVAGDGRGGISVVGLDGKRRALASGSPP